MAEEQRDLISDRGSGVLSVGDTQRCHCWGHGDGAHGVGEVGTVGTGNRGLLCSCGMEGAKVGSREHRVTVGWKIGRKLWQWDTVELRGPWKGPEHVCEARQGHGVAVG